MKYYWTSLYYHYGDIESYSYIMQEEYLDTQQEVLLELGDMAQLEQA